MAALPQAHMDAVIQRWISRPGKQCRDAILLMSSYLLLPSPGSKAAFLWQLEDREPLPELKARIWKEFSTHLATCEICSLRIAARFDDPVNGE